LTANVRSQCSRLICSNGSTLPLDLAKRSVDRLGVGHVAFERQEASVRRPAQIDAGDPCALRRECLRDPLTDPAGRTRHKRDPALEALEFHPPGGYLNP
jgi:hypothetical protein